MIMVDSSVWIDYFNGYETPETTKLDLWLGIQPISIGDIILTEVLQGFRNDSDYSIAKNLLTSLTIFDLLGENMAIKSAENYRHFIYHLTFIIYHSFGSRLETSPKLLLRGRERLETKMKDVQCSMFNVQCLVSYASKE